MGSILTSIKKLCQVAEADTSFDTDLIIYINSALTKLKELGVGPVEGVSIADSTQTWVGLYGEDVDQTLIRLFVYINVRLIFDPPTSSFVLDALRKELSETEWRLYVKADNELVTE